MTTSLFQNLRRGARVFVVSGALLICMQPLEAQHNYRRSPKAADPAGVRVVPNEAANRVDVLVNGQPFTSYIWTDSLMKPVLYPLRTERGTIVTRGFPLEPRPGERADHPHQIGAWLNYGDVNGIDFWNNSTARSAAEQTHMGKIVHQRILKISNGKTSGELDVEAIWLMPDGKTILRESTKYIFHATQGERAIDRITTLTALAERVVFKDSKEGMVALRVRRELEQPSTEPLIMIDQSGRPVRQAQQINTGLTGQYRSSEGKLGDDVWGTRGRWAMLTGTVDQEDVTLAILDHPRNIGYPTYWMARGYGLFGANPLGQKAYSIDKKESPVHELNFTLEPKQTVTFRYRLLILSKRATPEEVEAQYRQFVSTLR